MAPRSLSAPELSSQDTTIGSSDDPPLSVLALATPHAHMQLQRLLMRSGGRPPITRSFGSAAVGDGHAASSAPPARVEEDATTTRQTPDPYHIVNGNLSRVGEALWTLDSPGEKPVTVDNSKLDFKYMWLERLAISQSRLRHVDATVATAATAATPPAAAGSAVGPPMVRNVSVVPVCCRMHKSRSISDIRLIGRVDRVVRGSPGRKEYGFIEHPLFPNNLYFRSADLDKTTTTPTPSSTSAHAAGFFKHARDGGAPRSVNPGAVVAFRVGRNCLLYTSPSPRDRG